LAPKINRRNRIKNRFACVASKKNNKNLKQNKHELKRSETKNVKQNDAKRNEKNEAKFTMIFLIFL
jgi:hypothetical protein